MNVPKKPFPQDRLHVEGIPWVGPYKYIIYLFVFPYASLLEFTDLPNCFRLHEPDAGPINYYFTKTVIKSLLPNHIPKLFLEILN
jgi:hypothetical protein